jgi:hypothetical protein
MERPSMKRPLCLVAVAVLSPGEGRLPHGENCGEDRDSFMLVRFAVMLCLVAACGRAVGAQTAQPGVFHETGTGLTMRYPVELVVRDAQKAIDEGHLAVFGSMQNEAKEHELASRCLKPILLAELTDGSPQGKAPSGASAATLLLFEFIASKECKAGFKYQDDESVAGGLAQVVLQLPGAIALSRPIWFDVGKQQLHIAFSAFGLQNTSPDRPHSLIATAAMQYHGHILGWLMSASQLTTFNGLTKTSIQLDDAKIYALVPFDLDDHLRLPINIVK